MGSFSTPDLTWLLQQGDSNRREGGSVLPSVEAKANGSLRPQARGLAASSCGAVLLLSRDAEPMNRRFWTQKFLPTRQPPSRGSTHTLGPLDCRSIPAGCHREMKQGEAKRAHRLVMTTVQRRSCTSFIAALFTKPRRRHVPRVHQQTSE